MADMALNGAISQYNEARGKLLSPHKIPDTEGSPLIRIRNPSLRRRSTKRPEYVRMRTFGSSADKCGPHQAAREGHLNVLRDFKESSEGLADKDVNGFEPIHHAARADQAEAVELLLDATIDVNTPGGDEQITPLHVAVRYNSLKAAKVLMHHGANPAAKNANGSTPLHFSARHGSRALTELLLSDARANVNIPDNGGVTAFHLACVRGNVQMVELCLIHEADIWLKTDEGRNALYLAASNGHKDVADMIIRHAKPQTHLLGGFVNGQDFEDNTALHASCQGGHVSTVEVFLTHGADLEARNAWGLNTALHVASLAGHVDVVRVLLSRGADVEARNAEQRVALHLAAQFGHCDVIKCLLENGAVIDPREEDSLTPFLLAARSGMNEAAKLLVESGANPGLRTEALKTCFHLAVQNKHIDTLRMLFELCDADLLNAGDKELRTPLHHAAFSGQREIIRLLLAQKAKIGARDVFDRTPLHMAAENGNESCAIALVNAAPTDINITDDSGITPLHIAAMKGHRKVCKYFLSIGADLNAKDSNRWTPLHHAADAGHVRIVEILLCGSNVGSSYTLEAEDSQGNTPFIIAGGRGQADVVRLLVERSADVTARNKKGMTALDVAMENGKAPVVMEILTSDSWFDAMRPRPADGVVPMKNLIENMPEIAETVMDRCIRCSDHPPDHPDYSVEFDFRLLDTKLDDNDGKLGKDAAPRFFAPSTMADKEQENLLMHDLTHGLLQWKWNCIGRPVFWFNFITFLIYVGLFSGFLVEIREMQRFLKPGSNQTEEDNENTKLFTKKALKSFTSVVPVLIYIFVGLHMTKELYQIYLQRLTYFVHFSNYFEWAGYITSLMFIFPFLYGKNVYAGSGSLWPIGAVAIMLCFLNVVLFLRRFNIFGLYVTMYMEVLRTLIKVILVFFIFILAFAMAFYCLLKEQSAFKTFGWSIAKTFMMMVNGMDYQTTIVDALGQKNSRSGAPLVPMPSFTVAVMFLFVILIVILLINLLIGLAVGDIDAIQKKATMCLVAMDVEYVANIDDRFPKYFVGWTQKPIVVIKPNKKKNFLAFCRLVGIYNPTKSEARQKACENETLEDRLDTVNAEVAQQRTRIKKLQATVNHQTELLQSIAKQLQKVAGVPDTPVQLTMEGLGSTGSDLDVLSQPQPMSPTTIL